MDNYKARVAVYLRKSRADDENETIEQTLKKHEGILTEYAVTNLLISLHNKKG